MLLYETQVGFDHQRSFSFRIVSVPAPVIVMNSQRPRIGHQNIPRVSQTHEQIRVLEIKEKTGIKKTAGL